MLTPPTPPVKPTPPVAPTTPSGSNTGTHLPASAPDHSTQSVTKPANAEVSGIARELEGIRKAFQGQAMQTKDRPKTEPAPVTNKTNSSKAVPASFYSEEGKTAQTAVVTKPLALDNKPSGFSYIPFVGIVGVMAVVLFCLHVFKKQTKRPHTGSSKSTAPVMNKQEIDTIISPQTTAPKAKSNFEVRV